MISRIFGKITAKKQSFLVIETSAGLGYKVFAPIATLEKVAENKEIYLWTHLAVRENALDLYGFESEEDLEFFEMLITVSGIGPKTALNILNIVSIENLKQAVRSENIAHLVKVSGIGRKTAEKIMLELRDKIGKGTNDSETLRDDSDAVEALSSLGYSQKEARDALKNIPSEISGTSDKVKHALKFLSKR